MKLFSIAKALLGSIALICVGTVQAQANGLSYTGYNIGYLSTNRFSASDTDGANFSGSFAINESLFASANFSALKSISAGKLGVGVHVPAPVPALKDVDLYAIASVARNTNYNKGWGPSLALGAKTMLTPKWELNLYGSYTNLNTLGVERETSVSLGYVLAKDLIVRARSFRSTGGQGYEVGVGSRF